MDDLFESEGFPNLLKAGRWALTLIETGLSIFLVLWFPNRPIGAWAAMLVLFVYNVVVLVLISCKPLSRIPIGLLIVLDLVFLTNTCAWTLGIASPFLGQYYLIVFVGALFYNIRGGLAAGLTAALLTVLLAVGDLVMNGAPPDWKIMRDTAPYFVIVGGFTGYLVREMKRWRQVDVVRRRELELAHEIQQSSLPATPPTVPGVELALATVPSREVGGDLHVFVTDPAGERLGLAVGDVSGKGIAAALIATSIGYLLPYLNPLVAPHAALRRLNHDLCQRLPDAAFATLIYVELDLNNGQVELWNAGHPAALLWRAHERTLVASTEGLAPPLGMFPGWRTTPQTFPLAPGDLLVLYSDGLVEARAASGEAFGEERLEQAVARLADRGADAVAAGLLAEVQAFGAFADDVTVIVCQRSLAYPGI